MMDKRTKVPLPDGWGIVMPHDPAMKNRVMVFHNGNFLPQPSYDYQFEEVEGPPGSLASFQSLTLLFEVKDGSVLTLIDPQDGRRWKLVYPGDWEKLV